MLRYTPILQIKAHDTTALNNQFPSEMLFTIKSNLIFYPQNTETTQNQIFHFHTPTTRHGSFLTENFQQPHPNWQADLLLC